MIKVENNKVVIKGTKVDLIVELMCAMRYMLEKGVVNREDLLHYTILTCLSDDEIKQILINVIDEMDDIGEAWKLLNMLG